MAKFNKAPFTLLITTLVVSVLSAIPLQATIRQQPQQLLTNVNNTYLALSWGDIWNILRRKKVPGGGRGDVCLIAPRPLVDSNSRNEGNQEIWSLQPLFLWYIQKQAVQKIELVQKGSYEVFWNRKITPGETKVIYDGKPLQPGQSYIWLVYDNAPSPRKSTSVEFQVMETQKRARITNEITQLETRLKKEGANTEKIALEKANYFIQQSLWSDALREIYTAPSSPELTRIIQQISSFNYCDTAGA